MEEIALPEPDIYGKMSVEEALARRCSTRSFSSTPLSLKQLGQILWAAQGMVKKVRGRRTAPSAGATYPLEIYVVIGKGGVENLGSGIYHYIPRRHSIVKIKDGDYRRELAIAALRQYFIAEAPISIIITAIYERTTEWYGRRGIRYVHFEVGHVGQNIHLQAEALGLGTVMIGAFHDEEVAKILGIEKGENVLYIAPIGRPK
ncbi:MAG TPA: SagB/ThcOx family dehydrogenase [Thermoprotei archaeon]|nr:SagB/ThcOx family dehydrogenase [Thermoprotei archaeon]